MKTQDRLHRARFRPRARALARRGFALIVTISLMVLLSLLAVGLLGLSSRALSTSSEQAALVEARTNARLALELAIAQLQRTTGPDQRITAPADQRSEPGDGSSSSAAATRRFWTGAFESWPDTSETRPEPEFLSWLVSGDPTQLDSAALAENEDAGDRFIELVGEGTLGDAVEGRVTVPVVELETRFGAPARIAWWVGDQGTKAALSSPPIQEDSSIAATRSFTQSAPWNAVGLMHSGAERPFRELDPLSPQLAFLTGFQQASLLTDAKSAHKGLFHDVAASSTGLLTNVRAGGFRRDLSQQLELPERQQQREEPLYRVRGETGINLHELWAYYNLHGELQNRGRDPFTTGGSMDPQTLHLRLAANPGQCKNDTWHHFKQPAIISYQMVLSFETRTILVSGRELHRLQVVADPIITLWNPLDVPVSLPRTAFMSVKYWQIPYTLEVRINGSAPRRYPLAASLQGSTSSSDGDGNYLTLNFGKTEQLVLKPGEVIKVSQSGDKIYKEGGASDRHGLLGRSGFNYGGGVSLPVKDLSGRTVDLRETDTIEYRAFPNNLTAGKRGSSGNSVTGSDRHTRHFSLTHHEVYIGEDRGSNSLGVGNMVIDWDFGNQRLRPRDRVRTANAPGSKNTRERLYADRFPTVFRSVDGNQTRPLTVAQMSSSKAPFMLVSYNAKTENGSELGTRCMSRFNPRAFHVDFYDLSEAERDMLPYEFSVEPLVSWKNRNLEVSTTGNAYFGGGMNAEYGTSFVTTHSVPREPIVSLAALQHSMANGFEFQAPVYEYATLNAREPLLPQISHAIGNSLAPSVIPPNRTESTVAGNRPLADHSYLANLALWDDWFFSGIAPQRARTFANTRSQKEVAEEFFSGTTPLPTVRYLPETDDTSADELVSRFFSGRFPTDEAITELASYIRVDGAFNVNSTSIEAWKAVLGSLKGRPVITRDPLGSENVTPAADENEIPVANLHSPEDRVAPGATMVDVGETGQWVGRRTLNEEELDRLARAIVREVRKRGPFLSLADFVNRRVSSDRDLARAGAIQSALDSDEAQLNAGYLSGTREVGDATAGRFVFPEAEEGAASYGIPGIIKQADILTPIAPILSARSDSFVIRSYGEAVDAAGRVTARAWCEAVVERDRNFLNRDDEAETPVPQLTADENKTFGRRYEVRSFRWLNPEEV